MDFLDDLRDSRTTIGKAFLSFVALLLLSFLAILAMSGLVIRGILRPDRTSGGASVEQILNPPEAVTFVVPGDKTYEGWLFSGLRTAPTIILCHGYGGQRSDLLTMVNSLREHQYSVFVFDFRGHGANEGSTTLGPSEAAAVRAVIEELAQRHDLDGTRFGIWGTDLGGYAAFVAAASDPRVKAVAVDSVYDEPSQFVSLQIQRTGLGSVPLVGPFTRLAYRLMNWSSRNEPPLSDRLATMNQVAKLFIQGRDNPVLADATLQLFLKAPEPRAQAVFPRTGYSTMPDTEKRDYEREVLNFFITNLPAAAPPPAR